MPSQETRLNFSTHLYLLWHCILAYPLENIVSRNLAAWREGRGVWLQQFYLSTKCDLIVQKCFSGGTILGAFVRIAEMLQALPPVWWLFDTQE
jgi:hypothetical protein